MALVQPKRMSDEAFSFISAALERDPGDRATSSELIRHPWITQHTVRAIRCLPFVNATLLRRSRSRHAGSPWHDCRVSAAPELPAQPDTAAAVQRGQDHSRLCTRHCRGQGRHSSSAPGPRQGVGHGALLSVAEYMVCAACTRSCVGVRPGITCGRCSSTWSAWLVQGALRARVPVWMF
jgi:hypothetical protein